MLLGVALGLLTALGHSLGYLAARWYTQDRGGSTVRLLVLAHVMMGLGSAAVLPWLWPDALGFDPRWTGPLLGIIGFWLVAQSCLFVSLKHTDASRVAPLLGLKVALLALIAVGLGDRLGAWQWAGVGLAVASAWVLNGVGGRLPLKVTALVVVACAGYAVSDTFIVVTIEEVREQTGDRSILGIPIWSAATAYTVIGVLAAALLPKFGSRDPKAWRDALPYAVSWVFTMVCLYATFAMLGAVLGAILQSTRGLISIGLGVLLAAWGHHHLEQKHGAAVVWRRVGAAALMTAAVALYVLGR
jgi:drug/metabolite transporter (DMT)-like permease